MRGKSLVRESGCSSVCAFCAHRLGQARQSSHPPRRILHSSRAASRPPGEAATTGESNDSKANTPSGNWGRPAAGLGPLNKNTPAWGRGAIPGRGGIPGGTWGSSNGTGIPPRAGNGDQVVENTAEAPKIAELLPHEQRARDLMLEREAKAQQRHVNIPTGPGPQATRSGRYEPRTVQQQADSARKMQEITRARETKDNRLGRRASVSNGAPSIVRMVGGRDRMEDSIPARERRNEDQPSNWGQLRRSGQPPSSGSNTADLQRESFAEARNQREEQSRLGRYTPLGRVPQAETSTNQSESRSESRLTGSSPTSSPFVTDLKPQSQPKESNASESKDLPVPEPKIAEPTVTYTPVRTEQGPIPPTISDSKEAAEQKTEEKMTEQPDEEAQPARKKREKKRRGKPDSTEVTYGKMARGGDRDKARRRQQFVQEEDEETVEAAREEARLRAEAKAERKREKAAKKPVPIMLPEFISVSNLAIALRVRQEEFVTKMVELGFEEVNHDFILNAENAGLIAMEYNFEPIIDRGESGDLRAMNPPEDTSNLPSRPPVVTIMGHVDHGKTTILDYLRKSSVAATEHGGITQHIGAFSVPMPSGKTITFLDTPGHAAFLSMRQRGANVTDIVILVVAADDSVMPQTVEAINHAKAAKVPIIVAVNKIDKEDSDVEKVKQDLARHGVDVEDYGGDTQVVCVSGKTGQGMDELEEAAVALSDILDMRADRDCPAEGWVIEASIKSMGKCATVLVRRGTMRPGDFIVAGTTWARIRCLRNEAGVDIEEAGPGMPVEIDGWREQPLAGDEVLQAPDEGKAKSVVDYRIGREERNRLAEDMEAINENRKVESDKKVREKLEAKAANEGVELEIPEQKVGGPKQVYFIVKGDVSGSVEAVCDSISVLGNKEVHPYVLRSGVGQVSEFDVEHASAAKGHIISFNTEVDPHILRIADASKVKIIDQNIIYRLVDEVKAKLSEYLPPLVTQMVIGEADISQVFSITVKGRQVKNVAGCKVRNGTIARNARVRVLRRGEKIYDGTLSSLKNVKRDVAEMKKGTECGLSFESWAEFEAGDQIQTYEQKEEKRYL